MNYEQEIENLRAWLTDHGFYLSTGETEYQWRRSMSQQVWENWTLDTRVRVGFKQPPILPAQIPASDLDSRNYPSFWVNGAPKDGRFPKNTIRVNTVDEVKAAIVTIILGGGDSPQD